MALLNRFRNFLFPEPGIALEKMPPVRRFLVQAVRFAVSAALEFHEAALSHRASGLVYTTLLSIVPFLAVAFSVLKAFGVHHQIEPVLSEALAPLGPNGALITRRIIEFVDNLKVGVLGAVGVAGLFFTSLALVDQIEHALNAVWRVRRPRSLARKFSDYLSLVLVGPVLLFAALAVIASAQSHWLVQRVLQVEAVGVVVLIAVRLMPLIFLCGAFTFLFKWVPYTQVRLTSALVGGTTAAILWQGAGWAFASFVAGSARYTAIYSGLAILVIFLIWVYVAWWIILVGAQVAYFHQHRRAYLNREMWRRDSPAMRERLALIVLIHLTRRHLAGEGPQPSDELAMELNVPLAVLEDLMEEFIVSGFVHRASEPEGIALGRPPESISVVEVFDRMGRRGDRPEEWSSVRTPIEEVLDRRERAVRRELEGTTLRSLAEETKTADSGDG